MGTPAGFTLGELAATLGATLEGDPGRRVTGVASLDAAGPEQISFLIDARYRPAAETSRAGALLVSEGVSGLPGPLLRTRTPQQAMIALLTLFHPEAAPPPGIDASAIVAREAHVDPSASIGALAVIGAECSIHVSCCARGCVWGAAWSYRPAPSSAAMDSAMSSTTAATGRFLRSAP